MLVDEAQVILSAAPAGAMVMVIIMPIIPKLNNNSQLS